MTPNFTPFCSKLNTFRDTALPLIPMEHRPVKKMLRSTRIKRNKQCKQSDAFASKLINNPLVFIASGHKVPPGFSKRSHGRQGIRFFADSPSASHLHQRRPTIGIPSMNSVDKSQSMPPHYFSMACNRYACKPYGSSNFSKIF